MQTPDLVAGIVIAVGLAGILVPFLPGTALIAITVVFWAAEVSSPAAWSVAAVAVTVLAAGSAAKYLMPGRRLRAAGVPNRTLLAGAGLGLIGFFVVPVVGLLLGFVLGVYLSELQRVGSEQAWPATKLALRAVGLSILLELAAGAVAALVWLVGAVTT